MPHTAAPQYPLPDVRNTGHHILRLRQGHAGEVDPQRAEYDALWDDISELLLLGSRTYPSEKYESQL